jgi:hypothetical protein
MITDACLIVQDNTSVAYQSWCQYWQVVKTASALAAEQFGLEASYENLGSVAAVDPYTSNPSNLSALLRLDSGIGSAGPNNVSVALQVLNNGAAFENGIVFGSTSLDTAAGRIAPAMMMGQNQGLEWDSAASTKLAQIYGWLSGSYPQIVVNLGGNGSMTWEIGGTAFLTADVTDLYPNVTNAVNLGGASNLWKAVYTTAATIGAGSSITSSGPGGALTAVAFASFGTASGNAAQGGVITAGGPTGSATVVPIITYNAAGQLTTVSSATIAPNISNVAGLGTNVEAALTNTLNATSGLVGYGGSMGNVTGHASLDLPLTGGTMSGTVTFADNTTATSTGFTFATSIIGAAWVVPLGAGGSLASSTLTLESTYGAGTTDSIIFKTGSQVTALTLDTNQKATFTSHILAASTSPTISACGTGSPSVAGSDNFGKITTGGGTLTSCVINFGKTWGTAPACTVSFSASTLAVTVASSTTQLTVGATSLTSETIFYDCGSVS